jgi:hypothetical protein
METTGRRPRTGRATRWYAVLVTAFMVIRAGTTFVAGASFGLPGDGWRSVFQLAIAAVLICGLVLGRTAPAAVVVGVAYSVSTVLEAFHGTDLLGVIPVDMRDRYVHPALAVAAFACLLAERWMRTPRQSYDVT